MKYLFVTSQTVALMTLLCVVPLAARTPAERDSVAARARALEDALIAKAKTAKDTVVDKTKAAKDAVVDGANKARKAIAEKAESARGAIVDKATAVKDTVVSKADELKGTLSERADDAQKAAKKSTRSLKESTVAFGQAAKDTVVAAAKAAKDTTVRLAKSVKNTATGWMKSKKKKPTESAVVASDADVDASWPLMLKAIMDDDKATVEVWLQQPGADLNREIVVGSASTRPLRVARSADMCDFLIAHGARVDDYTNGTTALLEAVVHDDLPVVTALIAHGADVNACERDEETGKPTDWPIVSFARSLPVAQALVAAGAVLEEEGMLSASELAALNGSVAGNEDVMAFLRKTEAMRAAAKK